MLDIYVCGHGGWATIGYSSIFVQVPQGCQVLFYKEIGEVLYLEEAMAILRRAGNASIPVRTVTPNQSCPDMTLYPAEKFWGEFGAAANAGGVNWHAVQSETRLNYFLKRYPYAHIHWIACSVRELSPTGR